MALRSHNRQCLGLTSYSPVYTSSTFSRARLPPTFWLSARHLCCFSPPPPHKQQMCTPLVFYKHLFSLNHPVTQLHVTQPPVTQPVLCALHPTPRQHPCYPPTMSHSKPLTPVITPTLHDHPRTNLVLWKIAINRAARLKTSRAAGPALACRSAGIGKSGRALSCCPAGVLRIAQTASSHTLNRKP